MVVNLGVRVRDRDHKGALSDVHVVCAQQPRLRAPCACEDSEDKERKVGAFKAHVASRPIGIILYEVFGATVGVSFSPGDEEYFYKQGQQ